jgi:RNA polymerase sigma-70 factor (ECF subfamily)
MDMTNPLTPTAPNKSRRGSKVNELKVTRRTGVEGDLNARVNSLMARVARGDEAAFEDLYDELSGPVFGLVLKLVRDRAQSEEVAQEVMLEVWRQAPRYSSSRGTARSWVLTMAHHKAVDRIRSSEASQARDDKVGREEVPAFDSVVEEVESRLASQEVRSALEELTEVQREALTLAYYKGMTQQEVSVALDVPLGTVKTRMRDGLIRLRDKLGVGA